MSLIDVEFRGRESLKNSLSSKQLKINATNALIRARNKVKTELRKGVKKRYTVTSKLDSVLFEKGSISGEIINQTLTYKYRPEPLHRFNHISRQVKVNSRFLKKVKGRLKLLQTDKAFEILARVERNSSLKVITSKKGFKGFKIRKGKGKGKVFARKQTATWIVEPETRAPIEPLWGPSLSQMASKVFERSKNIPKILDEILKEF